MAANTQFIRFGKQKIHYDIVRSNKRKKTEIIMVDSANVKVLAPAQKPTEEIRQIVESSSRWIFRKQLRLREYKNTRLTYFDGSTLPYLGRKYLLRVFDSHNNNGHESCSFMKGKFIIETKGKEPHMIRTLYEKWLERRATDIPEKKVNEYSNLLKIDRSKLRINIKSQKNRLGSLGKKLTLNFNKNLLRLPPKIIDYIVVHELCHTKVPDHSRSYWQIVGLIIPDYKKKKEWLRNFFYYFDTQSAKLGIVSLQKDNFG
jgi:predicted metal-dependent hydrolase